MRFFLDDDDDDNAQSVMMMMTMTMLMMLMMMMMMCGETEAGGVAPTSLLQTNSWPQYFHHDGDRHYHHDSNGEGGHTCHRND